MNLTDRIKKMPLGIKIACSAAVVAVIAAVIVVIVLSQNGYVANTMRLLRVEGTVTIEDSKGGTKPVIDNIRFQSGDALSTGSDGLASVGLDDTKIITLQSDSRAEFTKQGKHLELKLTKGAVFFNVTEKLQPDETFEIKTSTMTAGIRGTSGIVYADGDGSLIVTDGTVEVTATNPDTGETRKALVSGGERIKVYLYSDRSENTVEFYLDEVTEEDLSDFTLEMLVENDELLNRVCEYTGWDKETLVGFVNDINSGKVTGQQVTLTPTPTSSPTPSPSATPTATVTPTPSTSVTPTVSPTPKPDSDPDPSATPTSTPTATPTVTPTATATPTAIPTPTTKPTPTETPIEYEYIVENKLYEDDYGTRRVTIRCYVNDDEETVYEGLLDGEWVPLIHEEWSEEYSGGEYYYLTDSDTVYYSYEWEEENPYTYVIESATYEGRTISIRYYVDESNNYIYEGLYNGEWILLINRSTSVGTRGTDVYYFDDNPDELYYYNEWTDPDYEMPTPGPSLPEGRTKTQYWGEVYNGSKIYICSDDEGNEYGYTDEGWKLLDDSVLAVPGAGVAYVIAGTNDEYFVYIEAPPVYVG